ncbi:MAG: hypothetical protein AB1631_31790 [Acidobacteriota bacterium]
MSDTATPKTGYAATVEGLSFDPLLDLLRRAHGDRTIFYLLRSPVEICGIKTGSLESIAQQAKRFAEGITFSERAEVRWKTRSGEKLSVLVLTESAELRDELTENSSEFPINKLDDEFAVASYDHDEHDEKDEDEVISPAKFWTPHETRLPKGVEYPKELFLIYAVYCDAKTGAAQLTRLMPRMKAQVLEERNKTR